MEQSLEGKLKIARAALGTFSLAARKQCIEKFRTALAEAKANLAELMAHEVGKPIGQGIGEVEACDYRIEFLLAEVDRIMEDEIPAPLMSKSDIVRYEPKGVCVFICAWNFPILMLVDYLVPAILTGNSVLIKPSEYATECAQRLVSLVHGCGCPNEVLMVCQGDYTIGEQLAKSNDVDSLVFIGSSRVGEKIARASPPFRTLVLEMGGNDGFYVDKSVQVETLLDPIVAGTFDMMGENCDAIERLYVHEAIYEDFLQKYVDKVNAFVVGDPLQKKTYIGPLFCEAHVETMESFVADAVAKGARLLCGGKRVAGLKGNYFEPTVLADCTDAMRVVQEETFGPIATFIKVPEDIACDPAQVAHLLDSQHGLTAGVFASPDERGKALAYEILKRVNVGTVYFNQCGLVQPWMPWAGRNLSGRGTILGKHGIRECFLRSKAWFL